MPTPSSGSIGLFCSERVAESLETSSGPDQGPQGVAARFESVPTLRFLIMLAALALCLGLLGRFWWLFDLLANYRPHLGLMLAVLAVLAVPLDRSVALAAGLFAAIGLAAVLPLYLGTHPVPASDTQTIEILSFNVTVSNPNRLDIMDYILEEDPDVVFLFESNFVWESDVNRKEIPLVFVHRVPRDRVSGVTVLARSDLNPRQGPADFWREAASIEVDVDGRVIEILGVHPPSPRSGAWSEFRNEILQRTADWIAGRDEPVVLVGDLNISPWSARYRSLRWATGLVDSMAGEGLQASWPDGTGVFMIPIDHVLHTPDVGSTERRTGPAFGSAHRPVLVSVGHAG
jgi:endonuclease/exonuclease/phosphatase (EEP) superfamily protein YafD